MEPTESPLIETRTRWVMHTKVHKVEEKFRRDHISGTGPDTVFADFSLGWFVQFEGSMESIHFGMEPDLVPGDRVKITFQKETTNEVS